MSQIPRSLLHAFGSSIRKNSFNAQRNLVARASNVGISSLKEIDKGSVTGEKSRFPAFDRLKVRTESRVHNFSASCDLIIKFIKLGSINKNVSVQYCHYLSELARTGPEEDRKYYSSKCADLISYILRNQKDLPSYARTELMADVSNTSRENCLLVFRNYLDDEWIGRMSRANCIEFMSAYYKHQLWDEAQTMMSKPNFAMMNLHTIQPFVAAIIEAANRYCDESIDFQFREQLKEKVINHLFSVSEKCYENRVQFATKQRAEFVKALQAFGLEVRINAPIKMSGRCTGCNTNVPLYDRTLTESINEAVFKQLVLKGADKDLYLNAAPQDSQKFQSFLEGIFRRDNRPLDCVIDGLNVAFRNSLGHKYITKSFENNAQKTVKLQNPEQQARILMNILIRGNFLTNYKRILVIGKSHMLGWPGLTDFFLKHNIHFFPSFNRTEDDLFMLYASTLNPNTVLVTNDFLRDHLARLPLNDRQKLERWIDTHQVWVAHKNLMPTFSTPYEKIPSSNRDSRCFHIPMIDGDMIEDIGVTEPPPHLNPKMITWICCQLNSPNSQQA